MEIFVFDYNIEEFPSGAEFSEDIDIGIVFDVLVHFHDVWVILSESSLYQLSQYIKLIDDHFLKSDVFAALYLLHCPNVAC